MTKPKGDTEAHEYASWFPLDEGPNLWELAEDIKIVGQREPIAMYQGKILDGRRRELACIRAGVEPLRENWKGTDEEAAAFVISKNVHRRHLGEADRARIAAKYATMLRGNPHNPPSGGLSGKTDTPPSGGVSTEKAAAAMNVSPRAVERAKKVAKATPAVQQAVADKTITLSDAASVASEPPVIQEKAVEKVRSGQEKTATQAAAKVKPGNPHFDDRPFNVLYGKMIRFFDDRREAFGHGVRDHVPAHEQCIEAMSFVKEAWDKWQKETT